MSLGIQSIMSIATNSLYTSQTAIEVVGNNISNINTPGYSRQELLFSPNTPINTNGINIGQGCSVRDVRRNEDKFLQYQIYQNNSILGNFEAKSRNCMPLQEVFNENLDEGLSFALNDFFNALGDLASTPEGLPERTGVLGNAETMITNFHMMNSRLSEIADATDSEVRYTMQEINQLAISITDLNKNIASMEGTGSNANDFRNYRGELMSQLAEFIDFNSFEDKNGMVTIMVGNGMPLVEGITYGQLVPEYDVANHNYSNIIFENSRGGRVNITSQIQGGSLKGSLHIRDNMVENLRDRIDNMAYTLAEEFNILHRQGWNPNGNTNVDFFVDLGGVTEGAAGRIQISQNILDDVNNISAGETTSPGDNRNALLMAGLADEGLFNGGSWSFQDEYSSIVAGVGSESARMISSYNSQVKVTAQVKNARESVAGVNIEEEMASLMMFQESYQAAARLFNTVSEMINTLISLR